MVVNSIRAKERPIRHRKLTPTTALIFAAFLIVAAAVSIIGYDAYTGRLGFIGPQPIVIDNGSNRIIKVPPGGNVQAAIEIANGGDIVELQAGATYSGEVKLPRKQLTEFITIQSSSAKDLPVDKRVSPAQRSSMAIITGGMLGRPAVSAANGANHYRFIGIEFTAASSTYNYGLVRFGDGESADKLPDDLEIDRSYLHPFKTGVTRRGIALNSSNTTIKNSYIEGFGFPGEETQGIAGWTGTRNVRILNNYIEGGAENILIGGADPATADLIPVDIEVRGNHLNKPESWRENVMVKTLFELKNAKRVKFFDNKLTNNWQGEAFRITIRNQDGDAPFSTIEDVEIRNNLIDGAGAGVNILGQDDTYPSQTLKRLIIDNNLFLNIRSDGLFSGRAYFIMIADGESITISNNTAFNTGNIVTFHRAEPRGLVFRDNIVGHGDYGVHGLKDRNSSIVKSMFQNNLFINLNGLPSSDFSFPAGNTIVASMNEVGFADISKKDFRLIPGSKFKGKGFEGRDLGANVSVIKIESNN